MAEHLDERAAPADSEGQQDPSPACLLVLPPPEGAARWLRLAATTLGGYAPQPSVLRRSRQTVEGETRETLEVRRWSELSALSLGRPSAGGSLLLTGDGRLLESRVEGVRHLRRRQDESIDDEIYEFQEVLAPELGQLELVRLRCLERLHLWAFEHWEHLDWEQRSAVARHGGTWEQAQTALARVQEPDRTATFQLFLSEEVCPEFSNAVLSAGRSGELAPGVGAVPWLLSHPDWNLDEARVCIATRAVEADPPGAWALRNHPNPLVRLRLVDLLSGQAVDWIEWLSAETDGQVRDRLRHRIELNCTPALLVSRLLSESDRDRREALGWVLVHWKGRIERRSDIKALNRALFSSLGSENRTRLKDKLTRLGGLELRSRILR